MSEDLTTRQLPDLAAFGLDKLPSGDDLATDLAAARQRRTVDEANAAEMSGPGWYAPVPVAK